MKKMHALDALESQQFFQGKFIAAFENPAWFRPTDVDNLLGNPTKARTILGWDPQKTSFNELVDIMAKHDRALTET